MSDLFSLMNEGNRFMEREEWERAYDVLRRAEQLAGEENLEVAKALATVTFHLGRFADATRYYRRLLASGTAGPETIVGLAAACFHLGRHEECLALAEQAAVLDPQEYDAYCYGAAAALSLGELGKSQELAERGLQWFAEDFELHMARGIAAFRLGDDAAAEQALEQAVMLEDTRVQPLAYLLRLRDRQLSRAEATHEDLADWQDIADIEDRTDWESPAPEAREGSPGEHEDDDPAGLSILEEIFAEATSRREDSGVLHLWMGEAYLRRGLRKRAVVCFSEAARIDPELTGPSRNLALVSASMGAHRRALEHWTRELDLDPTRSEHYVGYARSAAAIGDAEGAARAMRHALAFAPETHPRREAWTRKLEQLERDHLSAAPASRFKGAGERGAGERGRAGEWEGDDPGSPGQCVSCRRQLARLRRETGTVRPSLCRACATLHRSRALLFGVHAVNTIAVVGVLIPLLVTGLRGGALVLDGFAVFLAIAGAASTFALLVATFSTAVLRRGRLAGQLVSDAVSGAVSGGSTGGSGGQVSRSERHGHADLAPGLWLSFWLDVRRSVFAPWLRLPPFVEGSPPPGVWIARALVPHPLALPLLPLTSLLLYLVPDARGAVLWACIVAAGVLVWVVRRFWMRGRVGMRGRRRACPDEVRERRGTGVFEHQPAAIELRTGEPVELVRTTRLAAAAGVLVLVVLVARLFSGFDPWLLFGDGSGSGAVGWFSWILTLVATGAPFVALALLGGVLFESARLLAYADGE